LLWIDERLTATQIAVDRRTDETEARLAALNSRIEGLEHHVNNELSRKIETLTPRSEFDLLKSSLEVPGELIEEFQDWKARNPIPERPLVSVCIPTYNRARLLTERSIPSVLRQTYTNFELIVVGDGCTDETVEAVARIDDPRLRFVNLPVRGVYPSDPMRRWMVAGTQAVNRALAMTQGDYITHLDDDDEHLPERLEKLVTFAKSHGCDFVWHPFWMEDLTGNWTLQESHELAFTQVTTSSVFYRAWFKNIEWDVNAHLLAEPGDWNRFRRIKYLNPVALRFPEPLLRHYREREHVPINEK
jgi:glycosyltransferase involved in cell wall biosynthesis